jgi:hypothetical protein
VVSDGGESHARLEDRGLELRGRTFLTPMAERWGVARDGGRRLVAGVIGAGPTS